MKLHSIAIVALTLSFCGCAATSLKQTWKSPTYQGGPVQKIAVLAVDERDFYRTAVEGHFTSRLRARGQNALVTHEFLSLPAIKADKAAAAARVREVGADSVLIVRLASSISSASQVRVPPGFNAPGGTGAEAGDWYDYYSFAFLDMGAVWSNASREVCLETSLYDLTTGRRIWSGLTQTMLKDEVDRLEELSQLVKKVLAAMQQDGFIK